MTATVIAWLLCEVNNPFSGVPAPLPRAPISNDLYVVYLPRNTTITDGLTIPRFTVLGRTIGPLTVTHTSCSDYGAYHAFGTALTGLFAFAIVPTRCAVTSANGRPAIETSRSPRRTRSSKRRPIRSHWLPGSTTPCRLPRS